MIRGHVLVIDGDEAARNLGRVLQEKGFTVQTCEEARAGVRAALDETPDCIVCNPELPDIDGVWVVRRVRTESGRVAKVPIVFLGEGDAETRERSLHVGVDVFLARPITDEEVAAQVEALVAMAARFEDDDAPPSSLSSAAAIRGDLAAFPLASLLMMFEMERRSGIVTVSSVDGSRASLSLTGGLFSATEVNGAARGTLDVLRLVLSWRSGRFAFTPRESNTLPPPRGSVGALVLEAMRLEDEENTVATASAEARVTLGIHLRQSAPARHVAIQPPESVGLGHGCFWTASRQASRAFASTPRGHVFTSRSFFASSPSRSVHTASVA